ncbi:MAG: hypothetical protein K2X39_00135 [Silvanigrellaceae bacterium]|nr:hypothetical protein [Silvanigrellaceae bacterium]
MRLHKLIYIVKFIFFSGLLAEGFGPKTPVLTSKGHVPISSLEKKSELISHGLSINKNESDEVTEIKKIKAKKIIEIEIDGQTNIEVDPEQKFFSPLSKEKWIRAKDLKEKDTILKNMSKVGHVSRIKEIEKDQDLYAISVCKNHNFFVTESNILVHNFFGVELIAAVVTWVVANCEIYLGIDVVAVVVGAIVAKILTNKEARERARGIGWDEVKDFPHAKPGEVVFKHPKKDIWISPDKTGHGGGVWKEFGRNGRTGTLDGDFRRVRG